MSGAEVGPVSRAVAVNVECLRKVRGLTLRDLSARMADAGRPILPSVLHRLLQGGRRIDADDLVAFAKVLEIDPTTLLLSDLSVEIKARCRERASA